MNAYHGLLMGPGLACACIATAASAAPPAEGSAVSSPSSAPAQPASTAWSPPSDSDRSGEGNLHDAPLFEPAGQPRRFSVTYNPLTLFLVRAELSAEVMVSKSGNHHAINGSFFYGSTTTNSDSYNNVFQGFGGEIGYRYYSGNAGPRGLYVAPSFLIASYTAIPEHGAHVPFANLGGALDVGYQAILGDRWVVGLGAGLQYTAPTVNFLSQQLPASVYANSGLRPRLLLALGVAF